MLNNAIALIAVAALFGVEAIKVRERLPRAIFAGIAIVFALWAALVNQIADAWPKIGTFVTGIFAQPSSWFVLALALFFVLRPFWNRGVARTEGAPLPYLDHTEFDELRDQFAQMAKVVDGLLKSQGEMNKALTARLKGVEDRETGNFELHKGAQSVSLEQAKSLTEHKSHVEGALAALSHLFAEHKEHMAKCYSDEDAARLANVDALKKEIEARATTAFAMVAEVQKNALAEEKELRERAQQIEAWAKRIGDAVEHRFANLDLAFAALGNREKVIGCLVNFAMISTGSLPLSTLASEFRTGQNGKEPRRIGGASSMSGS